MIWMAGSFFNSLKELRKCEGMKYAGARGAFVAHPITLCRILVSSRCFLYSSLHALFLDYTSIFMTVL